MRYNKLIIIVRRNRNTTYGKEVEFNSMDNYKKVCGKLNLGNSDDDEADTDMNDDESFEAYDGFAGESTGDTWTSLSKIHYFDTNNNIKTYFALKYNAFNIINALYNIKNEEHNNIIVDEAYKHIIHNIHTTQFHK